MPAADIFDKALPSLISAASGLVGVILGGIITFRSQKLERRQRFIREQLSEFYAPMLGHRERLAARGAVRLRVHNVADSEWRHLAEQARENGEAAMRELEERRGPEFQRNRSYPQIPRTTRKKGEQGTEDSGAAATTCIP